MDGSATTFNNYCVRRRITERRIDDRVVYWWEYLNFRAAYGPYYNLISGNWELPDIVEDPWQMAAALTIRLASVLSDTV